MDWTNDYGIAKIFGTLKTHLVLGTFLNWIASRPRHYGVVVLFFPFLSSFVPVPFLSLFPFFVFAPVHGTNKEGRKRRRKKRVALAVPISISMATDYCEKLWKRPAKVCGAHSFISIYEGG